MKFTKDDFRILHAALDALLEGDADAWDDLSDDEIDRAQDIRDALTVEIDVSDRDDEEEDDKSEWDDEFAGKVDED